MELSLMTFSLMRDRVHRKLDADKLIRIAADSGLASVDLMATELGLYGKDKLKAAMENCGVHCGCLIASLPFYAAPDRVLAKAKEQLATARELGADMLMVVPGSADPRDVRAVKSLGKDKARELAVSHFQAIVQEAEGSGIRIGFENTPQAHKPLASAEDVEYVLSRVPGLGLIFDTGNFRVADANCDELAIYERLKSYIIRVHLKDVVIGSFHGKGERCMDGQSIVAVTTGSGVIPIREILERLKADGYDGGLAIEYSAKPDVSGSAHAQYVTAYADYIRGVLDGTLERPPYACIPGIPFPVSRIFFGSAVGVIPRGGNAESLLDAMVSAGINAFDTARGYGFAERSLGKWMRARNNRHRVVVLTKCGNAGPGGKVHVDRKVIKKELAKSLKELQTDYVDIFLLHRDDPKTPVSEIIEALNEEKRAGRLRIFGVSNWTDERIREANAYAEAHGLDGFRASSPNYGLAITADDPWGGETVSIAGPENQKAREWYAAEQMPVIAYSSLGRGFFSGKFKSGDYEEAKKVLDGPAQKGYLCAENMERLKRAEELAERDGSTVPRVAMQYVFASDMNMFAIVSTTNPSRMRENISAAAHPLTAADASYLEKGLKEGA